MHLRGIHTLNIGSCDQASIKDAAFEHLRGIHMLIIWYYRQFRTLPSCTCAGFRSSTWAAANRRTLGTRLLCTCAEFNCLT